MVGKGNLRIACYADIHGVLPEPVECDLALIAGDICPEGSWSHQLGFLQGPFTEWLKKFPYSMFIPGNHDHVMATNPELLPRFPWNAKLLNERGFCPTHHMSGWMWDGEYFAVYGMPWCLPYGSYPFMCGEEEISRRLVPARDCTVLLTHGPPYGYGDVVPRENKAGYEHAGSWALREFIDTYQPSLVVAGHIHSGYGVYYCGKTTIVNAAITDFARDEYARVRTFIKYPPIIVTMDGDRNIIGVENAV